MLDGRKPLETCHSATPFTVSDPSTYPATSVSLRPDTHVLCGVRIGVQAWYRVAGSSVLLESFYPATSSARTIKVRVSAREGREPAEQR